jgi:hypothetical protein
LDSMNLAYHRHSRMARYMPLNPTTSKVRVSLQKLSGVPNQTGRSIYPAGRACPARRHETTSCWAAAGPTQSPSATGYVRTTVQDVEAAASIHQHLGEPRVADDWIDDQRVLALVGMRFG